MGLFVLLSAGNLRWGMRPGVLGAAIAAAVCVYGARKQPGDRYAWLAAFGACASWALGHAVSPGQDAIASNLGVLGYALAFTIVHLTWPEIRRSVLGLAATATDTVTVVAAFVLWGVTGFPPFGAMVGGLTLEGAFRSTVLLVPVASALVVGPQLVASHKQRAGVLTAAMASLFLAELSQSGVLVLGRPGLLAGVLQSAGFALISWAVLYPSGAREQALDGEQRAGRPPTLIPGLLAPAAFAGAFLFPGGHSAVGPIAAIALGLALGARELLRELEGRQAERRLLAALRLGAWVASLPARQQVAAQDGFDEVCDATAEALRAQAALLWLKRGGSLAMVAAGPYRMGRLGGRSVRLDDPTSIAAQVVRHGQPVMSEAAPAEMRVLGPVGRASGATSVLGVPVAWGGREVLGALVLVRGQGQALFSPADEWKATLVGSQIASVLAQSRDYGDLQSRFSLSTVLHELAMEAVAAGNINQIGRLLLVTVHGRVAFDRGSVWLGDTTSMAGWRTIAHFTQRTGPTENLSPLRLALSCANAVLGEMVLERPAERPFTAQERAEAAALARFGAVLLYNRRVADEAERATASQRVERGKTDLLSAVSHDLKGAVTVIKGYASRLVDPDSELPEEEQAFSLRTIEEGATHLTDLLNDLLDLSSLEAGRVRLDPQVVNLRRLVEQAVSPLRRPSHRLEVEVAEELLVTSDRRRLRQVLDNLLDNAIKYSPDGGTVRVCATGGTAEVTIAVSDEGIGVPRHLRERIFQPYERDQRVEGRGIMGTGLGLAICKGIVEAQGGRIWVSEGEGGLGSIFSFTVPVAPNVSEI